MKTVHILDCSIEKVLFQNTARWHSLRRHFFHKCIFPTFEIQLFDYLSKTPMKLFCVTFSQLTHIPTSRGELMRTARQSQWSRSVTVWAVDTVCVRRGGLLCAAATPHCFMSHHHHSQRAPLLIQPFKNVSSFIFLRWDRKSKYLCHWWLCSWMLSFAVSTAVLSLRGTKFSVPCDAARVTRWPASASSSAYPQLDWAPWTCQSPACSASTSPPSSHQHQLSWMCPTTFRCFLTLNWFGQERERKEITTVVREIAVPIVVTHARTCNYAATALYCVSVWLCLSPSPNSHAYWPKRINIYAKHGS